MRPPIAKRRRHCTPDCNAPSTGQSASATACPFSSAMLSTCGPQRCWHTLVPAMPVRRSAPWFQSMIFPAASMNTTASYMLSNSRPWNALSTLDESAGDGTQLCSQ